MKLMVSGATGRLGTEIIAAANAKKIANYSLNRDDISDQTKLLSALAQLSAPALLCDVSVAEGTQNLCAALGNLSINQLKNIKALIIGTTGHTQAQLKSVEALSTKIPVVLCANFSLGILLFEAMLKAQTTFGLSVSDLARELGFSAGLVETHHAAKRDAPSGTAKLLAAAAKIDADKIASLRVGKVVGEHQVWLSGDAEELRLSHIAQTRHLFAVGALDLCERVSVCGELPPKIYARDFFYHKQLSQKTN